MPWNVLLRLVAYALSGRQRSFREDALACTSLLNPPLRFKVDTDNSTTGPRLVTINHYTRPGFRAWWLALAPSAVLPMEVHWVVTSAWTFPGRAWAPLLTPITRWVFGRLVNVYGFTSMPPMPPQPADTMARAQAVRKVFSYVRHKTRPVVGLAPEGRDFPDGILGHPPEGVGRFMLHLSKMGLVVQPVGAFEQDGRFCLNFGRPYCLEVSTGISPQERDRTATRIVMEQIALLLPEQMRGIYRKED